MKFIIVNIESPFAGNIDLNLKYVRACMRDCLLRGEAPLASHALYTQEGVLRDDLPEERKLGMEAGFAANMLTSKTVVYEDLGMAKGMLEGIERAKQAGRIVEFRNLEGWATPEDPLICKNPAAVAYDAYGKTTDYKNYLGLPMPEWEDLPEAIKKAWWAAANAVIAEVKP